MHVSSIEFLAEACEGELVSSPSAGTARGVSTDSRKVQPGDLFFAIPGEKFDGHDFLPEAATKGAAAVVVARSKAERATGLARSVSVILVENTRVALGKLAARYRADFQLPVIAIGGSNGKTTTKELLASVLRKKFKALSSEASFNNDIGVPLTLLKLELAHDAAVLEVGTNHPGELAPLLRMIQPSHGIITNIGREHLEFFGDVAGVAQEEGTLAEVLPVEGNLFVNGDNEWTPRLAQRTQARVVKVGFGAQNDWRAHDVRVGENGVSFKVAAPRLECSGEYRVRLVGRHQVPNALLALAAGTELGVSPDPAREGLAECIPPKMRLQISEANGVRLLDDTYNANADSTLMALQTLRDLPCAGKRVAVLGDMAELGEHTVAAHREAGRAAAELGIQRLIAVGRWAHETGQAARAAGLDEVLEFDNFESAAEAIRLAVAPGDTVLLKASRASRLERAVKPLRRDQ